MKCKNKRCDLVAGHKGRCLSIPPGSIVTTPGIAGNHTVTIVAPCNHCVTKDQEIERLKAELARLARSVIESAPPGPNAIMDEMRARKAKRDRAAYMRDYRKRPLSSAYTDELDDAARKKPLGIAYG